MRNSPSKFKTMSALIATLCLSACVSASSPELGLVETPGSGQSATAAVLNTDVLSLSGSGSEAPEKLNVIIPSPAPRGPASLAAASPEGSPQLLAAVDASKPVVPADQVVQQAVNNGVTSSQNGLVPTVRPKEDVSKSDANAPKPGSDPASSGVAVASINAEVLRETNTGNPPPSKNVGFLSRLFGNNQSGKAKKKSNLPGPARGEAATVQKSKSPQAKPKRVVKKERKKVKVAGLSATRRNANPLPGVKSVRELLGINDAETRDELESKNTRLAALGGFGRLSPNGLRVQHEKVQVSCLKPGVLKILKIVERRYGKKPIITSGYRSPKRNRRAGGARNSMHIFCKAVDIQVEGVSKWQLAKYLRTIPGRGGVGTYCRTRSVHIDIGKKRDWHHPCRRGKVKKRRKA